MAGSMSNRDLRPETIAAHALKAIDEATGAVVPPIYMSSTYARDETYTPRLRENYVRNGNPTLWQAEEAIAALGERSGCAALRLRHGGDHHADRDGSAGCPCGGAGRDVLRHARLAEASGGARAHQRSRSSIRVQMAHWRARCRRARTDLVWIETPLNPTWDVIDIAAAAKASHAAGAILAVDATATAAVTTQPLTLGADLVFHSATKYLNGHSDVLAGVLVTGEVTDRWRQVAALRTKMGAPLPPFECWLLMRGLRTVLCATARPPPMPWPSRGISRAIPRWSACSIPAFRPIRAMTWQPARCATASAA